MLFLQKSKAMTRNMAHNAKLNGDEISENGHITVQN